MKTKAFFLICLFMCIGFGQLYAQHGKNSTQGSFVYTMDFYYEMEVYCGSNVVDYLTGNLSMKETDLYVNGVIVRGEVTIWGELTSSNTGEVFKMKMNGKGWGEVLDPFNESFQNAAFHYNLIGDQGSHYIGEFSFDPDGFYFENPRCPGM